MAPHSKFLELLEGNRQYLTEAKFVKGSEGSQLPPSGDEEEPETPEEEPTPSGEELPNAGGENSEEQDQNDPASVKRWDGRELVVLEIAKKLYDVLEKDMDKKKEIQRLWDSGKYGNVYNQLAQLDIINPV
jgi:hypothetical protein